MKKDKFNWYQYLTEDFKLPRDAYTVSDKAVFDCPKCKSASMVRINHVIEKLEKLSYYECSKCRKRASIKRARKVCDEKYDGVNAFKLDKVKEKIKKTNLERYGVDCILKTDIRERGVKKIKEMREQARGFKYPDFSKLSSQEKSAAYDKIRNKLDKKYNIRKRLYGFISRTIKQANFPHINSRTKFIKTMPYSADELVAHIENQFKDGMCWVNRGEWHIDHIIPLSKFNVLTEEGIKEANALKNLRPIWKAANLKKSARLPAIIVITGCFGSGKTTLCSKLNIPIFSHDLKQDELDIAKSDMDLVVFETGTNVGNYLQRFRQFFKVHLVVILENENTIRARIKSRGGNISDSTLQSRVKRMSQLAKEANFSGTADECLQYLRNKIKQFV